MIVMIYGFKIFYLDKGCVVCYNENRNGVTRWKKENSRCPHKADARIANFMTMTKN